MLRYFIIAADLNQTHICFAQYVGFISYTILIYDIIITFSDEVEYIWKWRGRRSFCTSIVYV